MIAPAPDRCESCGAAIAQPPANGRRRRTCSDRCRKRLYRAETFKAEHGAWPHGWRPFGAPADQPPPPSPKKA